MPFEWSCSRVKKACKSMEIKINANFSFTRTLLDDKIRFFSFIAQDGVDGKGLKFEKNDQRFQVWMQFNPKIKIYFIIRDSYS